MLRLYVLASGSKGNASIVFDTDTEYGILIDCGISKREFLNRCDAVSFDPSKITDILVTHEHTDHTKGLGVLMRGLAKMGCAPTLRTSKAILDSSPEIADALETEGSQYEVWNNTQTFDLNGVAVTPFHTSHDSCDSYGFRFEKRCLRTNAVEPYTFTDSIGFMTDTGYVTSEAKEALHYCRILALESNHDTDMLRNGPYPHYLKMRIASDTGHLSNAQIASEIENMFSVLGGLSAEHIVGMHISQENNTYDLPKYTIGSVLEKSASSAELHIAMQMHAIAIG